MPRVLLNKEMNMPQYFTEWMLVQMHRQKVTQTMLAKELNVTRQAVSNKIRRNQYSFDEFIKITNYLKATEKDLVKLTKV